MASLLQLITDQLSHGKAGAPGYLGKPICEFFRHPQGKQCITHQPLVYYVERLESGAPNLEFRPEQADDVVRGNHAGEYTIVVNDGEGDQVVLVKKLRDFFFAGAGVGGNQRLLGQG